MVEPVMAGLKLAKARKTISHFERGYFNVSRQTRRGIEVLGDNGAARSIEWVEEGHVRSATQISDTARVCDQQTASASSTAETSSSEVTRTITPGINVGSILALIPFGIVALLIAGGLLGVGFYSINVPVQDKPAIQKVTQGTSLPSPAQTTLQHPAPSTFSRHVSALDPPDHVTPVSPPSPPPRAPKPAVAGETSATGHIPRAPPQSAPTSQPTTNEEVGFALSLDEWLAQHLRDVKSTTSRHASAPAQSTITPPGRTFTPREATLTPPPDETALPQQAVPAPVVMGSPVNPSRDRRRDARLRFLRNQETQIEQQLTRADLSATETSRLERRKAYWARAIERTLSEP
jgi:hypothetical protein